MTEPNYNGRQPNNTAFIKTFIEGSPPVLWIPDTYSNNNVVTTAIPDYDNVYIPGILYVNEIKLTNSNLIEKLKSIPVFANLVNDNNVNLINDSNVNLNYTDLITILFSKIQQMQNEIQRLKINYEVLKKDL